MTEEQSELVPLSQAIVFLRECSSIQEAKHYRDLAEAARVYAETSKLGTEAQNAAVEIKLRAERRMGQILTATPKHEGGRPSKTSIGDDTGFEKPQTLEEMGVSKMQSSRWQQEATLPEEDFERYVAETKADGGELTSAGLLKETRKHKRGEREAERAVLAARAWELPANERWGLELGNVETYQTEQRFDFIITDPPYPHEYLYLYGVLAQRALEWLEPSGLLLAMCGQSYLDQVMAMMGKYLEYYWTGCYLTPGEPTPLRQRQVNTTWKPVLVYQIPGQSYKGKIFGDVWRSDRRDKDYHEWGQSVSGMQSVISQVCLPGQIIFDPFCGSGSTGVAALKHGCLFHGIDVDDVALGVARGRLYDEATP